VNKFWTSRSIAELTLSTNFRQKHTVFDPRGGATVSRLSIRALPLLPDRPHLGLIAMGSLAIPCAIGRNGIGPKLHEGDGRTPIGRFTIVEWRRRKNIWAIFRPDCRTIKRTDGWCDDPASYCYNRPVTLPFRAGAEYLWRDDGVYDVIGILDFNFSPRVNGRGSSIFIHLAHDDCRATAGCIAIRRATMQKMQILCSAKAKVSIG
jgi:L,D-peptidoglycan transpeptidase YkuD (ErfK/YbiS/YcfS/YnhG family)